MFDSLRQDRDAIESNLESELVWQKLPDKKACRIKWPNPIESRVTELTPDQRTDLIDWGVETMDTFQGEFEPRVSGLELGDS